MKKIMVVKVNYVTYSEADGVEFVNMGLEDEQGDNVELRLPIEHVSRVVRMMEIYLKVGDSPGEVVE